jgi:hypothetical protein
MTTSMAATTSSATVVVLVVVGGVLVGGVIQRWLSRWRRTCILRCTPSGRRAVSVACLVSASHEVSTVMMSSRASTKVGNLGSRGNSLENTKFNWIHVVDELMDQGTILNNSIAVGKRVGQLTKPMTIVVAHHLALNEIVEFTFKVNNMARFVAGEEIADMKPYLVSSGTAKMETYIHEILRDCRVEPITNKEILCGLS